MFVGLYWNQPICVSVCVPNKSNFVLQTPTGLLLLYRKLVDTLMVYWSCARHSFQPWFKSYHQLNLEKIW